MIRRVLRPRAVALLLAAAGLSVAASPSPFGDPIEGAALVGARALAGELFHVQGLALDGERLWVTSVDKAAGRGFLHELDRETGAQLRRLELTDGARFHPGGLSISGRSIWVPVAEYRPDSSAVLVEVDADTLRVRRRIAVADHLGCVAAAGRTLVAGNWNSRLFHVIDLADPARSRVVPNPTGTAYQDIKFSGGRIVAGGVRTLWSGTVDWLDWPSLRVARSLRAGAVGPVRPFGRGGPYTGEGLAIEDRDLYVLPEDGPSRLFHFRLDP
jgi:hypothetical protein